MARHFNGRLNAMRTTIDAAGRLVVPKSLRDQLGLTAGAVELSADGAALRVEPVVSDEVVEENGHLVIPAAGAVITDEMVRDALEAGRR